MVLQGTVTGVVVAVLAAACSSATVSPHSGSKPPSAAGPAAEVLFQEGLTFFNEQRHALAVDRFRDLLRHHTDAQAAPEALYFLGECYRLRNNTLKAALAYEALKRHYPDHPVTRKVERERAHFLRETPDSLEVLLNREVVSPVALSVTGQTSMNRTGKPRKLNLIAKTEVVHEEARAAQRQTRVSKAGMGRFFHTLRDWLESLSGTGRGRGNGKRRGILENMLD